MIPDTPGTVIRNTCSIWQEIIITNSNSPHSDSSESVITAVWFRQDLRLADNPALVAAVAAGSVLPIYILDDHNSAEWAMGAASRWWLHYSLQALNAALGGRLLVARGDALTLIPQLLATGDIDTIHWNRCYEPWRIQRDKVLKEKLSSVGIESKSFNGSLLWEPWQVLKSDQTPYKVFTPYYRRGCLQSQPPALPLAAPEQIQFAKIHRLQAPGKTGFALGENAIDSLELLPTIAWDKDMHETWDIGEAAALRRLQCFLETGLNGYKTGRNIPSQQHVSRLSPHLHFGEISPRQVWHLVQIYGHEAGAENDLDCFLSEMGWREFSYYLLYYNPELMRTNIQSKFDRFPWSNNADDLRAWQQGKTGFPLVDAGMRELWQTGYMHNRVRMVTGSFLVKNLLLHWHAGEEWFWDCLVDADLAANSASWQWIAGCGADAAPYFRVFNPITQGERFDPQGKYLRKYLPELAALPDKYIHNPAAAPAHILKEAHVLLGENYPLPIVDLKTSRERALAAFKTL